MYYMQIRLSVDEKVQKPESPLVNTLKLSACFPKKEIKKLKKLLCV